MSESMILVTGASGLLGANFIQAAKDRGHELVAVSHSVKVQFPDIPVISCDLTDQAAVSHAVSEYHPDWIVHCAALTNVDWCEDHPRQTFLVNETMSGYLAEAAEKTGASIVYISTDSVFDGNKGHYKEDDLPSPMNIYAKAKLAGERKTREMTGRHLIIRTNIYGWNVQDKQSLAEWILSRLEAGSGLPAFCDVFFTPILVNDLAEAILFLMNQRSTGLYHISGSERCSKFEFAQVLADVFGLDSSLVRPASVSDLNFRAKRPLDTSLETGKSAALLPVPLPNVRSGLEHFRRLRETGYVQMLKSFHG